MQPFVDATAALLRPPLCFSSSCLTSLETWRHSSPYLQLAERPSPSSFPSRSVPAASLAVSSPTIGDPPPRPWRVATERSHARSRVSPCTDPESLARPRRASPPPPSSNRRQPPRSALPCPDDAACAADGAPYFYLKLRNGPPRPPCTPRPLHAIVAVVTFAHSTGGPCRRPHHRSAFCRAPSRPSQGLAGVPLDQTDFPRLAWSLSFSLSILFFWPGSAKMSPTVEHPRRTSPMPRLRSASSSSSNAWQPDMSMLTASGLR
jgi:hypothetical protein